MDKWDAKEKQMQIEHKINNYQILADDGEFHDFSGILETPNQKTVKINFIDGIS